MKIFKGETLSKTIESTETFIDGDKLEIKLFERGKDTLYYDEIVHINEDTKEVDLHITPEITSQFPCIHLILEIKMVGNNGFTKINQYDLEVKSRCFNE